MCGCKGKPDSGVGYTKTRDGRMVRNDRLSIAAMKQYGVANPTYIDGKMRWMGVDWYGVPHPVRLRLEKMGKLTHASKLPGCGCIVFLEDVWDKASLRFDSIKDSLWHKIRT